MTREEKAQVVAELKEVIGRSTGMYFTDFEGLTSGQTTALRSELRKAGVSFKVAKNTLIKRALDESGRLSPELSAALVNQTGVAFGFDDPVAPARVLKDFIDKNRATPTSEDKPSLKMAYVDGTVYPGKDLKKVAALPTKKEVIASILGSLEAPMSGLVGVLGALQRDIVYIMDAIEKKKAEGAAA
jgi:large subunit ribosomal protein L10